MEKEKNKDKFIDLILLRDMDEIYFDIDDNDFFETRQIDNYLSSHFYKDYNDISFPPKIF